MVIALRRAGLGSMMGDDCTSGDCARLSWEQSREEIDPSVAFTSIFSRRDGVIDWRGCLDPAAQTVEVATSHVGMAVDPVVFDVVTSTLQAHRERREAAARPAPRPRSVTGSVTEPVTGARLVAVPVASAG
jgi:hypothetical protein